MEAKYTPPPHEANSSRLHITNIQVFNCACALPSYDISDEMKSAETNFKNELEKWFR